ncbi:MAG: hypothetical protein U1E31_02965, partial [Rickettsiales bacterium]
INSHQYINKAKYINQLRFLEQNSIDEIAINYTDKINQLIFNIQKDNLLKSEQEYVNILETNCNKKSCSVNFVILKIENNNIIKQKNSTAEIEFDFYLHNLNKNNLHKDKDQQIINFKVNKYTFK